MSILAFLLGKKYGKAKDKKEKQKVLAYITMFFLVPLALIFLFLGDYLLLGVSVVPIVFLYLMFFK